MMQITGSEMMKQFIPQQAYFEEDALSYHLGQKIYDQLQEMGVPIYKTTSHNRITGFTSKSIPENYYKAKRTLVIGVRRTLNFATCKPSAHYQLPIATSCPSSCEYCYLATTLGKKPYVRIYVNIEEILHKTAQYIKEKEPEVTVFEGAATSDPLPTEYLTGLLAKTITFFGEQPYGRFRFVTKHEGIDSLLTLNHQKRTRIRFSINHDEVIKRYEHNTASLTERLKAAQKAAQAGYPIGFIIAPVFLESGWQSDYLRFIEKISTILGDGIEDLHFEVISHRFTKRAKAQIQEIWPTTALPLNEESRKFKFGQFGYGKYIYTQESLTEMKEFFSSQINEKFPLANINYVI